MFSMHFPSAAAATQLTDQQKFFDCKDRYPPIRHFREVSTSLNNWQIHQLIYPRAYLEIVFISKSPVHLEVEYLIFWLDGA